MRIIKRCLSLLLLCTLLLAMLPAAEAASGATLSLETSHSGSEWTVTVKLSGNKRPQMIEFCLEYDSSRLKLKDVKAGSVFSSSNAPTFSTPKAGRVLFAWESLTGLKDGKLLVLTFTKKSGAKGDAKVYFNEDYNTVFMDGDMNEITVTLRRTEIDLDEWDDDDDDDDWDDDYPYYTPRPTATPVPYEPDDDDWDDGDGDYDPDDPYATPVPWWYEPPEETPIPVGDDDTDPSYTMADMTIYVGQTCTTQEGFLFLSSDSKVVLIENGQLRGVSVGITTVTAYKDGAAVGTCTITVLEDPAHAVEPASSSGGGGFLTVVLWIGIALILISVTVIVIILIKRSRA